MPANRSEEPLSKKTQNHGDALHIVFGDSAGGTLRRALREARREEKVVAYWDDLSFGPISPPDPADRAAWAGRELRFPMHRLGFSLERNVTIISDDPPNAARKLLNEVAKFWDEVLSAHGRRVIWMSRRAAYEYAGFLECIWRIGDERLDVGDLTEISVAWPNGRREPVMSVGELPPRVFAENTLWDRAAPLTPGERDRYREMWRKLRVENAPFRVVAGDDLVSAPITFYDEWLMSCTVGQWRKAARVIAETMRTAMTHGHYVGDLVLSGRLQALAAAGRLESQGDLSKPRFSEVRLRSAG
jgi:hypothetical protein